MQCITRQLLMVPNTAFQSSLFSLIVSEVHIVRSFRACQQNFVTQRLEMHKKFGECEFPNPDADCLSPAGGAFADLITQS